MKKGVQKLTLTEKIKCSLLYTQRQKSSAGILEILAAVPPIMGSKARVWRAEGTHPSLPAPAPHIPARSNYLQLVLQLERTLSAATCGSVCPNGADSAGMQNARAVERWLPLLKLQKIHWTVGGWGGNAQAET